jgi:hypothetical protein
LKQGAITGSAVAARWLSGSVGHLRSKLLSLRVRALQTSIQADGFRSLREGEEVEYDVEEGPDGRTKAVKVTGPEGAAPQVLAGRSMLSIQALFSHRQLPA